MLNADSSLIYTVSAFGLASTIKLIYLTLNSTDGTIIGNRYYSGFISCTDINNLLQSGTTQYITAICSISYILAIDISTNQVSSYKINDSTITLYDLVYDSTTDRLEFVGDINQVQSYYSKTPLLKIDAHPDITLSTDITFTIFDDTIFTFGDDTGLSAVSNNSFVMPLSPSTINP